MPRIIYPENFTNQQKLLGNLLSNDELLGTDSPLRLLFRRLQISTTELQASAAAAAAQDELRLLNERDSESHTQKRNLNMKEPWSHLKGAVGFLKSLFVGNTRELGEWFIAVNGENKVVYPSSFSERAKLVENFIGKHKSFPEGESPLDIYLKKQKINLDDDLTAVTAAKDEDKLRAARNTDSKIATQQRKLIWAPTMEIVRKAGNFLMGLYGESFRDMGQWGFKVVNEPAGKQLQTSKIRPLDARRLKSIVVPSVVINIGTVALQIHKGAKITSDFVLLQPGEEFGITKGYSRIVVYNPSSLETGIITVVVSK